jgi:hypothetical protein
MDVPTAIEPFAKPISFRPGARPNDGFREELNPSYSPRTSSRFSRAAKAAGSFGSSPSRICA